MSRVPSPSATDWKAVQVVAETLGVSATYLRDLLRAGRVAGAMRIGKGHRSVWVIPVDKRGLPRILPPRRQLKTAAAQRLRR